MGEVIHLDPWSDEVCQDWIDFRIAQSRQEAYTTAEMNIVMQRTMPEVVREYLFRQAAHQLTYLFKVKPAETLGAIAPSGNLEVNVDISPTD